MAALHIYPLLSLEATRASTTLSKSSIYDLIGSGDFPAPVKISARRVAWKSEEVQAWLDSRPSTSNVGGVSHG